jgi:hypothetical protein
VHAEGDLFAHAVAEVWPTLDSETRTLLEAPQNLVVHAQQALVADMLCAEPADHGQDPAARVLGALPAASARELRQRVRALLPTNVARGADPFSFTARAQKRRGGVYTSRPLVDLLLDLVGFSGEERLLEPAVGSGAFLLRAWERATEAGLPSDGLQMAGVDVHPFACRAARTIALRQGATPPIHCADSLLANTGPAAQRGVYDLVLGNPPYVRGERIPAERRARYRQRFSGLGPGNADLASYFVAAGLEWLREGGRLAYVVSQGLLDARSTGGLRALLARHCVESVVSLEWAPGAFPDASVIPALLVVRRGAPPPDHQVALGRATWRRQPGGALDVSWTRLRQSSWLKLAVAGRWPLFLRRGDASTLRVLRAASTPLEAGYGLAIRTKVGAGRLVAEGPAPPPEFTAPRPLRDGREVAAWGLEPVARWIDYRPEAISDAKSEAYFAGPKLLISRIALTTQVAVDESDALCRNTVMVARAPGRDLYGVAAVIGSLPVRHYVFHLLRAGVLARSHRCTLYAKVLQALPLPEDTDGLAPLGREATRLTAAGEFEALFELEEEIDTQVALAFGLSPSQLARLRREAKRDPLLTILRPARPGQRRRKISVQTYAAGARYR